MDGHVLVRKPIDDIFGANVPAGGMREEADTWFFERRPTSTFEREDPRSFMQQRKKNLKGRNSGGLVLFKPDKDVHRQMIAELRHFRPVTEMTEQDFLSYCFGKSGSFGGNP